MWQKPADGHSTQAEGKSSGTLINRDLTASYHKAAILSL
jgi:hypothetical protein